jgi:hypothetical protein
MWGVGNNSHIIMKRKPINYLWAENSASGIQRTVLPFLWVFSFFLAQPQRAESKVMTNQVRYTNNDG